MHDFESLDNYQSAIVQLALNQNQALWEIAAQLAVMNQRQALPPLDDAFIDGACSNVATDIANGANTRDALDTLAQALKLRAGLTGNIAA